MRKKIGLFFGSFNPIHIGHLIVAEYFSDKLDQVWFLPTPHNPLKSEEGLLEYSSRRRILMNALNDTPFRINCCELGLQRPNYTYKTLEYLRGFYPDYEFVVLLGSDNINNFIRWKNYSDILEHHEIWCYLREPITNEISNHSSFKIFDDVPVLAISSSLIRDRINKGLSIKYLVPDIVLKSITTKYDPANFRHD